MAGMKRRAEKVSWRLKRRLGDVGYKLRMQRLPTTEAMTPSTTLIVGIMAAFTVFILVGGIYDLLEKPLAILPKGGGWTFVYRGSINAQTINESLVSGILYFMGMAGLYMLLRSTRLAYRPREAYLLLILGIVIVLMVVYYTNTLLQDKVGGGE
jgi:hypothetical protein